MNSSRLAVLLVLVTAAGTSGPSTEPPLPSDRGVVVRAWDPNGLPTEPGGRSVRSAGGGARYTPLRESRIIASVEVSPARAFDPLPFNVRDGEIVTLAWADLPMNGLGLLGLTARPGTDQEGIEFKQVGNTYYYSPGQIAASGVRYVDAYVRTGNPAYLDRAVVRARKLLELGRRSGEALVFPYGFAWPTEGLAAGWVSGYSQGFALSLFVRLYRVTGDWTWMESAQAIFQSFRLLGPKRSSWVAYAPNRYLWLEQYPARTPTHVLNGHLYALFGLYDYERLTRDPAATQMLRGAIATVRRFGPSYRVPGEISLYDLVHRTQHGHYHRIVIDQLEELTTMTGDPWFAELAATFRADQP